MPTATSSESAVAITPTCASCSSAPSALVSSSRTTWPIERPSTSRPVVVTRRLGAGLLGATPPARSHRRSAAAGGCPGRAPQRTRTLAVRATPRVPGAQPVDVTRGDRTGGRDCREAVESPRVPWRASTCVAARIALERVNEHHQRERDDLRRSTNLRLRRRTAVHRGRDVAASESERARAIERERAGGSDRGSRPAGGSTGRSRVRSHPPSHATRQGINGKHRLRPRRTCSTR